MEKLQLRKDFQSLKKDIVQKTRIVTEEEALLATVTLAKKLK